MHILEVIPLTALPPQAPQILSYFFDGKLTPGDLVQVSIGRRSVRAVVFSCVPLEQKKIAVKKARFQLKKISSVISNEPMVHPPQFSTALWLARQYYAPIGLCLKTVLPPFFGVKNYPLPSELWPPEKKTNDKQKPVILQVKAKDTLAELGPFLKKALEDGGQVLILAPETIIARHFAQVLGDSYKSVVYLSSDLPNAQSYSVWRGVADGSIRIVVSTRAGLFLPFRNLMLVAVEDSSNEAYKSDMAPRYFAPDLARHIADRHGALYVAVTPLPDTAQRHSAQTDAASLADHGNRPRTEIIIADAIHEMRTGNFSMFSRALQPLLEDAVRNRKHILIYSARRAYAGVFFCRNCGAIAKCPNCAIPFRVYKTPANLPGGSETLLICYHCSMYRTAPAACPNCASTQLASGGVAGSQKIREALVAFLKRFESGAEDTRIKPEIFILDSDLVRTQAAEDALLKKIDASPYPILIASQMIFSHRYSRQFALIAVPNADALTSGRDFRIEERFALQIEKLLDFRPDHLLMQTYHADSPLLSSAQTGDWDSFFEKELEARKAYNYPPFSRLAKLTYRHRDAKKAAMAARILGEKLKMVIHQLELKDSVSILGPSPASIAKEAGVYAYNIILKLSPLLERTDTILKYVPSDWMIDLDPKNLV